MVIDVKKYREAFAQAHQEAMALSTEIGYVTKENVNMMLAKAAQHARSLAIESGFLTDKTKQQTVQKAHSQARALAGKLKNYTPQ